MTHPKASARKRGNPRPGAPAEGSPRDPSAQGPASEPAPDGRGATPGAAKRLRGAPDGGRAAAGPSVEAEARPGAATFEGQYRVDLPEAGFEGPLDLLLHLIQQHELDILDIPIRFVTEKFLQYLNVMRTLTIDVASEYLVMAATLAHIKSKMLLPTVPEGQEDGLPGEEEEDPRAELVRRLLEYQKYKAAAADLAERGTLGKDVFGRGSGEALPEGPAPFAKTGVFSLLDAFEKVLKRTNVKLDHEVIFDRISITDRMNELHDKLTVRRAMRFEDLLADAGRAVTRFDIIITFLAILEMAKLRMIRVYQSDPMATIHVELATGEGGERREGEEPTSGEGGEPKEGEHGSPPEAASATADGEEEP